MCIISQTNCGIIFIHTNIKTCEKHYFNAVHMSGKKGFYKTNVAVALSLKLHLKWQYQKSRYACYIILKTAFNTIYIVKIKDKMSAISDSLKLNVFSSPDWSNMNMFLFLFHTNHIKITQLGIEQRIYNRKGS